MESQTSVNEIAPSYVHIDGIDERDEQIDTNDYDNILKFYLPQSSRMKLLEDYAEKYPDQLIDMIRKITAVFSISPLKRIEKFIIAIYENKTFPLQIRIEAAETIYNTEQERVKQPGAIKSTIGLDALDSLVDDEMFETFHPLYKYQLYMTLIERGKKHRIDDLKKFLCANDNIPWKYKRIINLPEEFRLDICQEFMETTTDVRYKILACQYLRRLLKRQKRDCGIVKSVLKDIMTDKTQAHEVRADAADTLFRFGDENDVELAQQVIRELGGGDTIYENKENVHLDSIQQSARDIINSVNKIVKGTLKDFQAYVNYIIEHLNDEDNGKVFDAIERIDVDRNITDERTIKDVFCILCEYIITYSKENKNVLTQRLIEELEDMAGTCTSGYITRLANVLSGFGYNISISWKDQIQSVFTARLNALIMKDENVDEILSDMTSKSFSKPGFNTFFIKHLPTIREEMYAEYKDYISEDQWENYLKDTIVYYQSG